MPILIQELIASDSISQAVDKINFNFDQILLNGGGPVGPPGQTGPPGPIGGRGLRGSQWYEDTLPYPGISPNVASPIDPSLLLPDDNYLQANGDVWNWTGLTWTLTQVNLTGPQGAAGSSGSWFKFGADVDVASPGATGFAAVYPEPFGIVNGANLLNEGVSTIVAGGIVTKTPPISGINQDLSIIPDDIAKTISSDVSSMFIHQKSSANKGIIFHGGNATSGEYFEQTDIAYLSYIQLDIDDALKIVVPKQWRDPSSTLVGFTIQTETTGQYFRAGKHVLFSTGNDTDATQPSSGAPVSSDFTVNARQISSLSISSLPYPQINLNSLDSSGSNQARIQVGGNGTFVGPTPSTTNNGSIVLDGGYAFIYGRNRILLQGGQIDAVSAAGISASAVTGITLSTPASISLIGNTFVTCNFYVSLNTNLAGNLQVALASNLLGVLNVNGLTTLNDKLILNNAQLAAPADVTEVLVRDKVSHEVKTLVGAAPIPLGGIIMWSGDPVTTMPTNWALCDGIPRQLASGATITPPDLRERFIVGAGGKGTGTGDLYNYDTFQFFIGNLDLFTTSFPIGSTPNGTYNIVGGAAGSSYYLTTNSGGTSTIHSGTTPTPDNKNYYVYQKTSGASTYFFIYSDTVGNYVIIPGLFSTLNLSGSGSWTIYTLRDRYAKAAAQYDHIINPGGLKYMWRIDLPGISWGLLPGYNVGTVGGYNGVQLQTSQIGQHIHELTNIGNSRFGANPQENHGFHDNSFHSDYGDSDGNPPMSLGLQPSGSGLAHENRPPFYALAFIMYIGA